MNCQVCGDPMIGECTHAYSDHIVILPHELKSGDIWRGPDERIYLVNKVVFIEAKNQWPETMLPYWEVRTAQKKIFCIEHFYLPLLVKRNLICGAPVCELHCAACLERSERERGKREFLTNHQEERQRKKEIAKQHERFTKEVVLG